MEVEPAGFADPTGPAGLFLTRSSRGLYIEVGTCEPFCFVSDRSVTEIVAAPLPFGVESIHDVAVLVGHTGG
ncbi:MAG: hypothetical protein ACXWN0_00405, partial [Isosphaeraceae bacterium]